MGLTVSLLHQPVRALDTRTVGQPILDGREAFIIIAGQTFGTETIPASATGVIGNLTSVNATGDGFLVAYPSDGPPNPPPTVPATSSLNFVAGGPPVANLVISRIGPGGQQTGLNSLLIHAKVNGPGTVDVIFDVIGYLS
jgi:hypothetical protein